MLFTIYIQMLNRYHGYYFAWSIVYTFWYHPMENTWAHTSGFLHTGIVLIQGSLIYTDMHLNRQDYFYYEKFGINFLLPTCLVFSKALKIGVITIYFSW